MPVELAILIALFLVFLNGFFVAAEFALVKVRPTQIERLAAKGSRAARMAREATRHLDAYLSATQLGITLASIGLGFIGEPAFAVLLRPVFEALDIPESVAHGIAFGVAYATVSILHIVLGELAPKSWAIQKPERLALALAYPLHWFYVLFRPAIVVLNGLAGSLLRVFGIRPASDHEMAHSEEELRMLLTASSQSGVLTESEVDLMHHVFRFGDKDASDVMTPRVDIVGLAIDTTPAEALEKALSNPFSRYPVYSEDIDEIQGIVHIRDLVRLSQEQDGRLADGMREVLRIPESKRIDELLEDFQRERLHVAIVLDEYGGTAGMVTMEDILEQLVGSIADETDLEVTALEAKGDGWLMIGKLRLAEVNEVLGSHFESSDFDTIGGYVSGLIGRRPRPGMQARDGDWEFEIVEVDPTRVLRLFARRVPSKQH